MIVNNFKTSTVNYDLMIGALTNRQNLPDDDARITLFRKLAVITTHAQISFDFYFYQLKNDSDFWEKKHPNHIFSKHNKTRLSQDYEQEIRSYFVTSMYSAFESSIRVIVDTIDHERFSRDNRFSKICEWFFNEFNKTEQFQIMKVFSNIRNSMHNNGLFKPPSGQDEPISYQNKNFYFEYDKLVPYVGWSDLFSITKVITMTVYEILLSEQMSNIQFIEEPTSYYW